MLTAGCATKKYVKNTTAPIQAKVDQVGDQTTQNSQQIQDTNKKVSDVDDRAQNGISAANEKAGTADQHAGDAMNHANDAMTKATSADQKGDQNSDSITKLRDVVANIDDYKLQTTVTVPFKFDKAILTADTKTDLDKLATDVQGDKRYIISVEGYTDKTGSKAYNEALSKKRADAVVEYLVAKHDIPIYKIHMIGLADDKPVDEARNRDARAKNRRVEVKVFSADQVTSSLSESSANRADGK